MSLDMKKSVTANVTLLASQHVIFQANTQTILLIMKHSIEIQGDT